LAKVPVDGHVPDPLHLAEQKEALTRARRALLGLPFEYREALTLVGVERFSPKEAAEALGVPDATLRWRLHEARKLLRETLKEGR
jgi:RNA polymerase sigma-70 factor (ECF subfamily)